MELISIREAQLYLISGKESVLMQIGTFSLKLLKQAHSPLAAVVASVGEIQWPLGKDGPVLKVWDRRYAFALPKLLYGMVLPGFTPKGVLQQLESILAKYSILQTHHVTANLDQHLLVETGVGDNLGFWTAVAPEVEMKSSKVVSNSCSTSIATEKNIGMNSDRAAVGVQHGASGMKRKSPDSPTGGHGRVSSCMMGRMQEARRMSAVAKLMSMTLLKGAISATEHVSTILGSDMNSKSSSLIYGVQDESARNVAVASVNAFRKVVEAVETAGKWLYDRTKKEGTDISQERFVLQTGQGLRDEFDSQATVTNTTWTLNEMGEKMLLKMTLASTVAYTRSNSRTSTTSTVTSTGDKNLGSPESVGTGWVTSKSQKRDASHHQHRTTPSSQQAHQQSSSPRMRSGPQLHTSQLFPTSAEQMRNHAVVGLPAPSPLIMTRSGNCTAAASVSPNPHNSSFQQYHRHATQEDLPTVRFFQPEANYIQQME
jgi:spartin